MEIWRDIQGYENKYQVSNFGQIKSLNFNKTGKKKIMKLSPNKENYLHVGLCKHGISKVYRAHRIVAKHFLIQPNGKNQINHIDFNRQNNNIENLQWCTIQENNKHSLENYKRGENHSSVKLNELQVRIIRHLKGKLSETKIGNIFNVSRSCISKIYHNRSWKLCSPIQ